MLDHGSVVPRAVEQHHFARRRQLPDIALEVPLPLLAVGWLGQRHGAHHARVEVHANPGDRATLAGGVAAFEHHHDATARADDPVLQFRQLDLQRVHPRGIVATLQRFPIGVGRLQNLAAMGIPDRLAHRLGHVGGAGDEQMVVSGAHVGAFRMFGSRRP